MSDNTVESVGSAPADPPAEQVGSAPAGSQGDAPAKKKRGLVRILIWPIVVVVLFVGGWWLNRDSPTRAEVGSCLAGTTAAELNADKLKVVECGEADAGFKVEGRVEDKTSAESDGACDPYPSAEYVFWSGKEGAKGVVLCLSEVTH